MPRIILALAFAATVASGAMPAAAQQEITLTVAAGQPLRAMNPLNLVSEFYIPEVNKRIEAAGLDIYSTLRRGITVRNQAFAVLTVNGALGFYSVNLLTGKAEFEDNFKSTDQVVDIAIPLNQR